MHRPPGFPYFPRFRRRYRVRFHQPADGTTIHGLREESQAGIRHLSVPTNFHRGRGALQRDSNDAHHPRALRLRLLGGQRGDIRHMQKKLGHRATHVHKFEQATWTDSVVDHGLPSFRRRTERRFDRVSNELGPVSKDPFSIGDLRADRLDREGLSRTIDCDGADVGLLRAGDANGEVQSAEGKVYGVLFIVQGGCGTQGC